MGKFSNNPRISELQKDIQHLAMYIGQFQTPPPHTTYDKLKTDEDILKATGWMYYDISRDRSILVLKYGSVGINEDLLHDFKPTGTEYTVAFYNREKVFFHKLEKRKMKENPVYVPGKWEDKIQELKRAAPKIKRIQDDHARFPRSLYI